MHNRLAAIGVNLAFWIFLSLLFTPQTYIINLRAPTPLSWWQAFAANSVIFCIWACLTPFVLRLGQRFPLERPHLWRNALVLFPLSFPFSALHIMLVYAVNSIFLAWSGEYRPPVPVLGLIVGYGATNVMVYWGVIAVSQALIYFSRYREREKSLAQAQLQSLKTQLNPHFLFNTLNVISELVYENAGEADETIGKLSELLRMSLKTGQAQEIPLRRELQFARKYLEIQQTLLQDRLHVEWRIAPETYAACVPNMILQPLVENSIKHGIAPRRRGGNIIIESIRQDTNLVLRVADDGIGLKNDNMNETGGIGLANTTTRLRHLYGAAHDFTIRNLDGQRGVVVEIKVPYRENAKYYDEQDTHLDS